MSCKILCFVSSLFCACGAAISLAIDRSITSEINPGPCPHQDCHQTRGENVPLYKHLGSIRRVIGSSFRRPAAVIAYNNLLRGGGTSSQLHAGSIRGVYIEGRLRAESGNTPMVDTPGRNTLVIDLECN